MNNRPAVPRLVRLSLALTIAAIIPATASAQRAEGSFQRALTVGASPDVEISAGSGRIEVRAGSANRIEITGRIRAGDWGDGWFGGGTRLSPQERVRRVEASPPVEQSGNRIKIGYFTNDDWRNNVSISFTVALPTSANVIARTGSGSQRIEGVSGSVESHAGSGSLTLKDIGSRLRASTGSGSISVDGVRGALHLTSGSGTVRAAGITGGVTASTSSGGLTVEGELSDDWRLSASSGSVSVHLPRRQGFEVDVTTGSGSIDVDFPVTVNGKVGRRSLRGSAQGGGRLLHVRTSSGRVSIRPT